MSGGEHTSPDARLGRTEAATIVSRRVAEAAMYPGR